MQEISEFVHIRRRFFEILGNGWPNTSYSCGAAPYLHISGHCTLEYTRLLGFRSFEHQTSILKKRNWPRCASQGNVTTEKIIRHQDQLFKPQRSHDEHIQVRVSAEAPQSTLLRNVKLNWQFAHPSVKAICNLLKIAGLEAIDLPPFQCWKDTIMRCKPWKHLWRTWALPIEA